MYIPLTLAWAWMLMKSFVVVGFVVFSVIVVFSGGGGGGLKLNFHDRRHHQTLQFETGSFKVQGFVKVQNFCSLSVITCHEVAKHLSCLVM